MSDRGHEAFWATVRERAGRLCSAYSEEELAAFAEGSLGVGPKRVMEAHLAACADCRELVAELRQEVRATQTVFRVAPSRPRVWQWVLAPIAVAALVLVLVLALRSGPGAHPGAPGGLPTGTGSRYAQVHQPGGGSQPPQGGGQAQPGGTPAGTPKEPARSVPPRTVVASAPTRQGETPLPSIPGLGTVGPSHAPTPAPTSLSLDQAIATAPQAVNPAPSVYSFNRSDVDAIYEDAPKVDPAAHPELVNEGTGLRPPVPSGELPGLLTPPDTVTVPRRASGVHPPSQPLPPTTRFLPHPAPTAGSGTEGVAR